MRTVRQYYVAKRGTAKQKGIPFLLSESEMHWLFYMARITPDQVGRTIDAYCLARIEDTGPYAIGNCRFITNRANHQEKNHNYVRKVWTDEMKAEASAFTKMLHDTGRIQPKKTPRDARGKWTT